jgi:type VI protein secretion system component VasK
MEMNWSRWFRCESSFGMLLVPNQPGVFALAEEVVSAPNGRRMLAVLAVDETEDLALALSRLFAVGSPWREKLSDGRCFARYAVAPGIADRRAAADALKQWLEAQKDLAAQVFAKPSAPPAPAVNEEEDDETEVKTVAERAVDRVARSAYGKVLRTGY